MKTAFDELISRVDIIKESVSLKTLLYSEWLYSRSSYIFSSSHGAFTKSNHIMGHRRNLKELEE